MSSFGNSPTGAVGPAGYATEVRSTPLNRLENALNRLNSTSSDSIDIAVRLTGGWGRANGEGLGKDAPAPSGMFDQIDAIANAIHRLCDNLGEANSAVMGYLP